MMVEIKKWKGLWQMGERKNNERRKLEGKRQKQIATTDEKVRFF